MRTGKFGETQRRYALLAVEAGWTVTEVFRVVGITRVTFFREKKGLTLDLTPEPVHALLPLQALAGTPGIATRIRCEHCQFFRRYTVEAMIAQLTAAKKGDGRTGVLEVAALFTAPCKQCQKKAWSFEVLWPSEHTESWRRGVRP